MSKYIMALDAGTSSSRCILFNKQGEVMSMVQKEFAQIYPKPGWMEHNPMEIWETQLGVAREAMDKLGITADDIAGIGITNQRETTIVWDKHTGVPVYNAIVWQCRRTAGFCDTLVAKGLTSVIRKKTGLVIDAYFSATKIRWILDNVEGARERAKNGELLFGTVETWLIWNLTGGRVHATDYSNASRTMLFNINTLQWDDELIKEFDIPKSMLPEVRPSSGLFGKTSTNLFGGEINIAGAAGDQQCALFGQACFAPGDVKNTYGTGCFMLMNIGEKPVLSENGLVTTIAWGLNNKVYYALEGSVFDSGTGVQWLRDELQIIDSSNDSNIQASRVEDTNGCYMVPAFSGLGAPYWNQYARGCIVGLTRGINRFHIIRATLESPAYLVNDVLSSIRSDSGLNLSVIKVDGGGSRSDILMQLQADLSKVKVERPECVETTAIGAAYFAGLAVGYWESLDDIVKNRRVDKIYEPVMSDETREKRLAGWHRAVEKALDWEEKDS